MLAILVAAIATMVIGFLWYSPILFAKAWMQEMGIDPGDKAKIDAMRKSAGTAYSGSFVANLISAFVLALIFHHMKITSAEYGAILGIHVWLGFVATVQFTGALFAKPSMKLFAIDTGYQLVCQLTTGAVLAV